MVFFIELNKTGGSHAVINASMIKILSNGAENNKLIVYASKTHIENIKPFTSDYSNIEFLKINVIDKDFKTWILKELLEIYNLFLVLLRAKKAKAELVYISSLFPIAHYFFKRIKWWFPNVKVIVGLHGEMEFIRENKNFKLRFLGLFLKKAFRLKTDKKTNYLVFGDIIRINLLKYGLIKAEEFIVIDHPYEYKNITLNTQIKEEHQPTRLGTVGIGSINKNSQLLFSLGFTLQSLIKEKKIILSAIGRMSSDLKPFYNDFVEVPFNSAVEREDFDKEINKLDYTLFFYDNSFYQLCASGSLFDSINMEKPILAIRNDYFEYYFNMLGNIGYLFDDINEMELTIIDLCTGKLRDDFFLQKSNLVSAKKILSIENISKRFWEQYYFERY